MAEERVALLCLMSLISSRCTVSVTAQATETAAGPRAGHQRRNQLLLSMRDQPFRTAEPDSPSRVGGGGREGESVAAVKFRATTAVPASKVSFSPAGGEGRGARRNTLSISRSGLLMTNSFQQ